MPTITFDTVPFFFAVLALLISIYGIGDKSHEGWIAVIISVVVTVLTYVLFVGVIALGGG